MWSEDDVDAALVGDAPDFVGEGLFAVVDHVVRALRGDAFELAAGGGDDDFGIGGERTAQLDRRGGDTAAAAVDEHRLLALQFAEQEQVQPGGDVGFADAGGLLEGYRIGQRHGVPFERDRVFRVTAAADQRDHALAGFEPRSPGACRFDHAGHFQPEHLGIARRRRVVALALVHVRAVDRGRVHANQQLPFTRYRGVDIRVLHRFGSPEIAQRDRLHHQSPVVYCLARQSANHIGFSVRFQSRDGVYVRVDARMVIQIFNIAGQVLDLRAHRYIICASLPVLRDN